MSLINSAIAKTLMKNVAADFRKKGVTGIFIDLTPDENGEFSNVITFPSKEYVIMERKSIDEITQDLKNMKSIIENGVIMEETPTIFLNEKKQ